MSARINQLAALCFTLLALFPATGLTDTTGESIPTDVDDRWIPSFAIRSGATFQQMDSSVFSRCANGRPEEAVQIPGTDLFIDRNACADPNDPSAYGPDPPITPNLFDPNCPESVSVDGRSACLRPSERGTDLAVTPYVGGSIELMTPRVGLIPGRPRFFIGGELLSLYAVERNIAKEGNPSGLAFPPAGGTPNAAGTSGPTLFGTGSIVTSQVQRFGYSARTGFAFPFEFRERRLWLKSSFGWFQYEVDFEGQVLAGIKPDPTDDPNANSFAPGIREVSFSGSGSETFDSIGPGVELEMEVGRYGPVGVSLFLNFDAFWLIGDRSFGFSDSVTCPAFDPGNPTAGCAPTSLLQQVTPGAPFTPVPGAHMLADGDGDPETPPDVIVPMAGDTYDANFEFGVDSFVYRGGLGIRFSWLGR